jgi:hypothetical protein
MSPTTKLTHVVIIGRLSTSPTTPALPHGLQLGGAWSKAVLSAHQPIDKTGGSGEPLIADIVGLAVVERAFQGHAHMFRIRDQPIPEAFYTPVGPLSEETSLKAERPHNVVLSRPGLKTVRPQLSSERNPAEKSSSRIYLSMAVARVWFWSRAARVCSNAETFAISLIIWLPCLSICSPCFCNSLRSIGTNS